MSTPSDDPQSDSPPLDPLVAYVAGVLSTFTPLDQMHPMGCVAMAHAVLKALEEWKGFD
jgi:hypothetical protein